MRSDDSDIDRQTDWINDLRDDWMVRYTNIRLSISISRTVVMKRFNLFCWQVGCHLTQRCSDDVGNSLQSVTLLIKTFTEGMIPWYIVWINQHSTFDFQAGQNQNSGEWKKKSLREIKNLKEGLFFQCKLTLCKMKEGAWNETCFFFHFASAASECDYFSRPNFQTKNNSDLFCHHRQKKNFLDGLAFFFIWHLTHTTTFSVNVSYDFIIIHYYCVQNTV